MDGTETTLKEAIKNIHNSLNELDDSLRKYSRLHIEQSERVSGEIEESEERLKEIIKNDKTVWEM